MAKPAKEGLEEKKEADFLPVSERMTELLDNLEKMGISREKLKK